MRFPFLAAEYTNICAFATFRESSTVELLTEPKVLRPCGRPPRPGSGRCAGVSPLPSAVPPDPSPLRFAVPRLTAARTSDPCRDPATPVAVGLPVAGNVYTFPHLASWSARIVLAVGSIAAPSKVSISPGPGTVSKPAISCRVPIPTSDASPASIESAENRRFPSLSTAARPLRRGENAHENPAGFPRATPSPLGLFR